MKGNYKTSSQNKCWNVLKIPDWGYTPVRETQWEGDVSSEPWCCQSHLSVVDGSTTVHPHIVSPHCQKPTSYWQRLEAGGGGCLQAHFSHWWEVVNSSGVVPAGSLVRPLPLSVLWLSILTISSLFCSIDMWGPQLQSLLCRVSS